jgi:hypothetical protein
MLFLLLIALPAATHPEQHLTSTVSYKRDPRFERLKAYLSKRESPTVDLTADFIAAADRYSLDWRLLPAISVVESGAGKRYKNNNIFGWASCEVRFPTISYGIHYVASRLAESELYRDKTTEEKLRLYNPYDFYPGRVRSVMRAIGPADLEVTSFLD